MNFTPLDEPTYFIICASAAALHTCPCHRHCCAMDSTGGQGTHALQVQCEGCGALLEVRRIV